MIQDLRNSTVPMRNTFTTSIPDRVVDLRTYCHLYIVLKSVTFQATKSQIFQKDFHLWLYSKQWRSSAYLRKLKL